MSVQLAARPRALVVASAAVSAVIVAVLAVTGGLAAIDLQVYRFGVAALFSGADLYGELAATTAGIWLPFIYPPFAALVLAPLAALPWPVAAALVTLASVAALALTCHVVARRLWPAAPAGPLAAAVPVALLCEPVRSTLGFGQVNLWLMAMVVADCLLPRTRWPRGLLVGLAVAIKITPAAFLLFFLLRKDFRAVATAAATVAATVLAGVLAAPEASARYWFGELFTASGLSGSPFVTNQGIPGALARLDLPPAAHLAVTLVLAAGVAWAAVTAMRRLDPPEALLVNATAALVLSPISWSHHWVWVVPAALVLITRRSRWVAAAPVFVLPPQSWLPSAEHRELAWAPWQHLAGNAYLLTGLAALAGAAWLGRRHAGEH
ncbi:glycosyltransferase 87 family protein [Amycolatopsis suaedae]|uniref:DUF2029 domain-containing protein n=1 Tax=Amycolatopsis suaedae TaxID=2510978 RepID=A0A4Q7J3G4_9PSEU|nr:glycosyltransferase 87 family protein [Amycolatopsis suaedae]RZQ61519.1 DUF2029 domain-containing protein [Amycolatopsis suaedae]